MYNNEPQNATSNRTVRIHAEIVDRGNADFRKGTACIELYYYVRSLDPQGSGKAIVYTAEAAKELEKSDATIRRHLRNGEKLGIFRSVTKLAPKTYLVYYSSTTVVGLILGVPKLGACAEIPANEIKFLRFLGTQLAMQALQESARTAVQRAAKKRGRRSTSTPDPETFIPSSQISPGVKGIDAFGKRCTYVKPNARIYGVSQDTIAERTGRHVTTVQRRLSNRVRRAHGEKPGKTAVPFLPKAQLVRRLSEKMHDRAVYQAEIAHDPMPKVFQKKINGKVRSYEVKTNVYERQFILTSAAAIKREFNKVKESFQNILNSLWGLTAAVSAVKNAPLSIQLFHFIGFEPINPFIQTTALDIRV